MVKNITDYGAFIDLGGIDGLLHVTDMAWRRVNHPSEIVNVGDTVKVQIVRINPETQRISLGMKQLQADPWPAIEAKYPVGARFKGTVTNIADYGAFVELEPGVEGLIHVSEMSWTKKNIHPGKIVSTSQQVEVQILEVDAQKRRISLGLKQTQDNPWDAFLATHPKGSVVEGPIRNITEFGLFIGLDGGVDGMVHLSDLDWNKAGRRGHQGLQEGRHGQSRGARRRQHQGAHQPRHQAGRRRPARHDRQVQEGRQVTCEVIAVQENGIEVKIADTDITTFIKRSDLSRDRSEQRARALHGRREGRRRRHQRRQGRAAASMSRSRRSRSPRRSRPWRSTARPTRAPRSATSSRPPSRSARTPTKKKGDGASRPARLNDTKRPGARGDDFATRAFSLVFCSVSNMWLPWPPVEGGPQLA